MECRFSLGLDRGLIKGIDALDSTPLFAVIIANRSMQDERRLGTDFASA